MGSQNKEHKIPVVDFTKENLKPGSESWALACKKVRYGLEEYGCFEATYDHKIPIQLHNSIFAAAEEVFDLSLETKMKKTTDKPGCGYVGQNPDRPHYEAIGIDNPTNFEGALHFTKIMWPQGNDTFCESVYSFSKPMAELYEIATRMAFESYGVGMRQHESHMELISYGLRFFGYKARKPHESDVGVPTHTDKTFATILHQDQVSGLQIMTKHDHYIDIEPSSSSFLFIAADAFRAWSNDRIRACPHRVVMKEYRNRYSIGFYSIMNGLINVPEELVDEEYPLRYHEPMDHLKMISNFAKENAHRYPSSAVSVKD